MKKKKYIFIAVSLFLCLSVASCSDDDDFSSNDIIGKWTMISDVGYDYDFEYPEWDQEWDDKYERGQIIIEIEEDGSFYEDDKLENSKDYGQWRIKGSKLYLTYDDEDDYEVALTIASLTNSQLVLELYSKDQDYEHYSKTTWEKIN